MRILLLCHAFNSLTQRLFVELEARGHEVSVEFDINDAVALEAVALSAPELIIAPFLKRAIPAAIWRRHVCLVVHPGPVGDRGPAALDWAIAEGAADWGVTVLQAVAEMDAGPVWTHRAFAMRADGAVRKSSLYRHEVTEAATDAVLEAVQKFAGGRFTPRPPQTFPGVTPRWRGAMRQKARAISWNADDTATVIRKIAAADGMPGVRDTMFGEDVYLFDAHPASGLPPCEPGREVARSGVAVAKATTDGAVWIGHVRRADGSPCLKLPATRVFGDEAAALPEREGYRDLWYEEDSGVGYLHFPVYNGAMAASFCERLRAAFREALARPTRVIVLLGGPDHWSNGLNLNVIEAADSAADESWRNINAMDDLAEAVITATSHLVVSALGGNAGAGGVFLARAADEVWMRDGAILNPHYKDMGNLYGSEFWTYLLPRYAGPENARRIAEARLPMGVAEARDLGLADAVIPSGHRTFADHVRQRAECLAAGADIETRLAEKAARRARDEREKPLAAYRSEELERMRRNFYGFDPSYHVARYNFVHKVPKSRTPLTIARHRKVKATAQSPARAAS